MTKWAALIIALVSAALFCSPQAMAAGSPAPHMEKRIWYPAGHYPQLSLPGGKTIAIQSLLDITKRMHFGDYAWNQDNIAQGAAWVRIDLSHQIISVFRGGNEIGSAVILYGSDGTPTPVGSFPILQKSAHYFSHKYQAPMPYMLQLTSDGVAIHGSSVREGWATHGCIGVPIDFARLLFGVMNKGDLVSILPGR